MNNSTEKTFPGNPADSVEEGDAQSPSQMRKMEVRVRRKTDFAILPLLCSVYFLAQMVWQYSSH